jgi:hypothetical protein
LSVGSHTMDTSMSKIGAHRRVTWLKSTPLTVSGRRSVWIKYVRKILEDTGSERVRTILNRVMIVSIISNFIPRIKGIVTLSPAARWVQILHHRRI